jgi:hypothetical protein
VEFKLGAMVVVAMNGNLGYPQDTCGRESTPE